MFDGVGHARHAVLIAEAADVDVQGCTGLVRVRIVNEEGLEAIVEAYDAVLPVIERGLLELVRQERNRRLAAESGRRVRHGRGGHGREEAATTMGESRGETDCWMMEMR